MREILFRGKQVGQPRIVRGVEMKYTKCCRNCEHAYLESCKNCSTFGDNAYENFELRKELAKIESGKLVAMPVGWLDALKLLTCAAMCYADIDNMIARLEPTMVAVLAIVVGLILLSVMLPLAGVLAGIG